MAFHIGSWLSGRYTPLHFYGPSGSTPELGSKAIIDGMETGYAWDIATRTGALPDAGGKITVHEFDFRQENEIVYQDNGVTIRSWPWATTRYSRRTITRPLWMACAQPTTAHWPWPGT